MCKVEKVGAQDVMGRAGQVSASSDMLNPSAATDSRCPRCGLEDQLVHKTPAPILAGLERTHNWMTGLVVVLCRVLVRRAVATSHVTALETQPQVHPGAVHLETLLTSIRGLWFDVANLIKMGA